LQFLKTETTLLIAAVIAAGAFASGAGAVAPPWRNCAQVHAKYPHGVGKVGARDKTTGTPVTNFKRSNALYKMAMSNNRSLDRDKDGVACEAQ
jgi:Excalibur calcium-binding domain